MPLQVKGIIEAFATEGAEVSLGVAVALHVAVEEALEAEDLGTEAALELGRVTLSPGRRHLVQPSGLHRISGKGILNAIASIDDLQRSVWWQAKLKKREENQRKIQQEGNRAK
jgi:hypothetical protein